MLSNTYNINFELAAFIYIIILYVYLIKKYYNSTKVNVSFKHLVLSQLITLFLDLVTSFTIAYSSQIPFLVNMMLNTLYFASLSITCYMFGTFYLSFSPTTKLLKNIGLVFKVFIGVFGLLLFENIPTGIIFTFENGFYEHGPLYIICFVLPMLYFVLGAYILFTVRKSLKKITFGILLLLATLTTAGPVLQALVFPNVLLSNFFSIFALFFCLFILISPNYTELSKKRSQLLELQKNLEQRVQEESEKALQNEERMQQFTDQIVEMLATTINIGGANRENHSENVGKLSRMIAEELNLSKDEVQKIYYSAVLHDIGIIGLNEDVIEKQGPYTGDDYAEMKRHSEIGARILQTITEIPGMDIAVKYHHERFDGLGYPENLSGTDIPLGARIIAIADAYEAMTHDRSYRKTFTAPEAHQELLRCAGTQFDPEVVQAFLRIADKI